MKKQLRNLFVTIVFALPIVAVGSTSLVSAKNGADDNTSANTTAANNSSSNSTTETEVHSSTDTVSEQKSLQERLDAHKNELKTKLTTVEKARIKDRCKQAQAGGIESLNGRIKGIETSRKEVYSNLLDKLNKLVEKLKAKNVDTTKLESEITVLKGKIDTFNTDLATYKQSVADLKAMDCGADPTAFKAALEAARKERDGLKLEVADIKKYVTDTIKVTLKDIRSQLEAKETTESETEKSSQNTTGGN